MRFFMAAAAAFLLVAGLGGEARADDMYWVIDYRTSAPLANTSDFTGEFSWRGMGLEWHRMAGRQVSAGVGFGFNSFWEQTSEVISVDNVDVSGDQFRYTNALPIWGMFRYYPRPPEPGETRFFVGLDAGPYFVDRRLTIGFLATDEDNWHFGFAPEVGIQIPFTDLHPRPVQRALQLRPRSGRRAEPGMARFRDGGRGRHAVGRIADQGS